MIKVKKTNEGFEVSGPNADEVLKVISKLQEISIEMVVYDNGGEEDIIACPECGEEEELSDMIRENFLKCHTCGNEFPIF